MTRWLRGLAGFTLVELMVALAIIAVLAAIGVPNFMADMPRRRLAKAVRGLYGDLERTRMQAVTTNRSWKIEFNTGADRYEVWDSGDNNFSTVGDNVLVRSVSLADFGSGVQFGEGAATLNWANPPAALPTQANRITFTARGLCGPDSVFLTNQEAIMSYAITSSTGGGLRLRMFNGTNWIDQ